MRYYTIMLYTILLYYVLHLPRKHQDVDLDEEVRVRREERREGIVAERHLWVFGLGFCRGRMRPRRPCPGPGTRGATYIWHPQEVLPRTGDGGLSCDHMQPGMAIQILTPAARPRIEESVLLGCQGGLQESFASVPHTRHRCQRLESCEGLCEHRLRCNSLSSVVEHIRTG